MPLALEGRDVGENCRHLCALGSQVSGKPVSAEGVETLAPP